MKRHLAKILAATQIVTLAVAGVALWSAYGSGGEAEQSKSDYYDIGYLAGNLIITEDSWMRERRAFSNCEEAVDYYSKRAGIGTDREARTIEEKTEVWEGCRDRITKDLKLTPKVDEEG